MQRGRADLFLTGGADAKINPITMARQVLFSPLSRRNDAPEKACRPFDRGRDGVVLGEGGGVLVLEELEHARRRGARIYAEVIGFGAAFDRGLTGAGVVRAVRAALAEAGVGPDDLDHVNAQGYSTVRADAVEARALRELFGPSLPVFAAKSYFGNAGPASGPIELAASLLAAADGVLPATLNYEEPDPQCPVNILREPRPVRRPCFLKLGFTELGQCAAVVCRMQPGNAASSPRGSSPRGSSPRGSSFPSSAGERTSAKLCCAASRGSGREAELRNLAFPNRVWERGRNRVWERGR